MRRTWRTFFYAVIAVAVLVGLDYGYRNYLRPRFEPPKKEKAEEGPPLILELTGENYFAEFGNPKAATKVVAYVPDDPCHNEPIKFLVEKASHSPDDLYVKFIRMQTAEGTQALEAERKEMCARYEINGQSSFTLLSPDRPPARVQFEKAPEPGGWTLDELKLAVEQAQSGGKDLASSAGQPSKGQKPDMQGVPTAAPPSAAMESHQPHASLAMELLGDKVVGEWGDPGAPTKVVCYVPESPCHDECVRFLVDTAKQSPSQLHVRLVRMHTREGTEITKKEHGHVCAAYLINGKSTMTVTTPGRGIQQVTFETSPAAGAFTVQDLESAVQKAMAKSAAKKG